MTRLADTSTGCSDSNSAPTVEGQRCFQNHDLVILSSLFGMKSLGIMNHKGAIGLLLKGDYRRAKINWMGYWAWMNPFHKTFLRENLIDNFNKSILPSNLELGANLTPEDERLSLCFTPSSFATTASFPDDEMLPNAEADSRGPLGGLVITIFLRSGFVKFYC